VHHINGYAPNLIPRKGWDLDDSLRRQELAAKYGIHIDAYHLSLSSTGIDRVSTLIIMLGISPELDREIEMIQQMIESATNAKVRALRYKATILPIIRTIPTATRALLLAMDISKPSYKRSILNVLPKTEDGKRLGRLEQYAQLSRKVWKSGWAFCLGPKPL